MSMSNSNSSLEVESDEDIDTVMLRRNEVRFRYVNY